MGKLGCFLFIAAVAVGALECFTAYQMMYVISQDNRPEVLGVLICIGLLSWAGYMLMKYRIKGLQHAMLSGTMGPAVTGIVGSILIVVPGFLTGFAGCLLQIPFFQRLLGGTMLALVQAQAAKQFAKMGGGMPGGFPGNPAGGPFAGGKAGPFPGGGRFGGFPGMKPDDQVQKKSAKPKIIDTTAERE